MQGMMLEDLTVGTVGSGNIWIVLNICLAWLELVENTSRQSVVEVCEESDTRIDTES